MGKILKAIIFIWIIFCIAYVVTSCSSTKNIQKHTSEADSATIEELQEDNRYLRSQVDELNTKIRTSEYTSVVFDNNCDSVIRAAITRYGCNADSINKVMDFLKNRIKVFADGSTEYEGKIRSYVSQKNKFEEQVKKNQLTIDSLKSIKQKEVHWVRTVTITNTKYKKTGFPWLWFSVGIGIGIALLLLIMYLIGKYVNFEDKQTS